MVPNQHEKLLHAEENVSLVSNSEVADIYGDQSDLIELFEPVVHANSEGQEKASQVVGGEPNLSHKSDVSASESASLLSDDCDGSVLGEASEKTMATNLLGASNETPQYLIYQIFYLGLYFCMQNSCLVHYIIRCY